MKLEESFHLQLISYTVPKFEISLKPAEQNKKVSYSISLDNYPIEVSKQAVEEDDIRGTFNTKLSITGKQGRNAIRTIRMEFHSKWESNVQTEEEFVKKVDTIGVIHILSIARAFVISTTGQMGIKPIIMPLFNLSASKAHAMKKTTREKDRKP